MNRPHSRIAARGCLLAGVWAIAAAAPGLGEVSGADLFRDTIQPVLKQQCWGCHGDGNLFSGLDLRTRPAAQSGGRRGPAIVPGDPDRGTLVAALEHAGELKMPPGEPARKLPAEIRAAFRAWIAAGAPFPATESAGKWDYKEEDLWAFRPLTDPGPPDFPGTQPIDAFVLGALEAIGLKPAPQADKRTLLRRLTYDLTGLPPTYEEISAFLSDDSPGAYAKVVERLLASPRYGERWGRHWLDVTRYADTGGFSNDFERPTAWRYRDYVIRSFNADKPYDRFIREQVAGDELFPDDPEAILATGFLRTGPWEHTGMSVAAVTRQQFLDDVTHHVGTTFLGVTLACASCHDHKFDPIPTRDYYAMQAVFATTAFAQRPLPFQRAEATAGFEDGRAYFDAKLANLGRLIESLHGPARIRMAEAMGAAAAAKATSSELQRWMDGKDAETLKLYRKHQSLHKVSRSRYEPIATAVSSGLVEEWNDLPGSAATYLKKADYEQAETHVLVGGDLAAPGEEVAPAALQAVARYSGLPPPRIPATLAGRRSALAEWIADPRNPLPARVMANRIWLYHFGNGLAANANNFGKMGQKPTHPALLDWLARRFIESGWSVKALHRTILLSETYRRSSAHPDAEQAARHKRADPDNIYWARFPPRRLAAEELRDSILAVAGELSPAAGGPGSYPQINRRAASQPRHAMGTLQPTYEASPQRSQRNRRSVYSFQQRSLIDPLIETFDGANPDLSCERRESSTVPTQAFVLMNSELSHELALSAALRLEAEAETPGAAIRKAFELAYGRAPTREEFQAAQAHHRRLRARHEAKPAPPRTDPEPVLATISSELTGEHFQVLQPRDSVEYEHNPHPSEAGPATRALADLALVLFNSNEFAYVY